MRTIPKDLIDIQPLAIHCTLIGDNFADPIIVANFTEQILGHLDILYHMALRNTLNDSCINEVDLQLDGINVIAKIHATADKTSSDVNSNTNASSDMATSELRDMASLGSSLRASQEDIYKKATDFFKNTPRQIIEGAVNKLIDSNPKLRSSREDISTPIQEIVDTVIDEIVARSVCKSIDDCQSVNGIDVAVNGHRSPDENNLVADTPSDVPKAD